MRLAFVFAFLMACLPAANAGFPDSYKVIAIEPPLSFTERLVDLTSAIAQAKAEGKPLFIYVGANDCPPCRVYERFLEKHHADLEPAFQKVVIVDIRTWLEGPKFVFKIGEERYTRAEFKKLVGDRNEQSSYPYYWLLSAEVRQIKQLPRGGDNYLDVERHKALLAVSP